MHVRVTQRQGIRHGCVTRVRYVWGMEDDVIEELSDEPCGVANSAFRTILAARERATEAFHNHKKMLLGSTEAPAARGSANP